MSSFSVVEQKNLNCVSVSLTCPEFYQGTFSTAARLSWMVGVHSPDHSKDSHEIQGETMGWWGVSRSQGVDKMHRHPLPIFQGFGNSNLDQGKSLKLVKLGKFGSSGGCRAKTHNSGRAKTKKMSEQWCRAKTQPFLKVITFTVVWQRSSRWAINYCSLSHTALSCFYCASQCLESFCK